MERYIVVRGIQASRGGGAAGQRTRISFEDLSLRDAAALRREDDIDIAEAFPVKLVEPFAKGASAGDTWGITAIGADQATTSGANVRIAVLDTGIDRGHPAFAGISLVEKDFTGTGRGDENGHGTHCAGTIFGRDVDGHRIGIARGVTDARIGKVLDKNGRGTSEMVIRALQWAAAERADVISMSLGFDFGAMVEKLVQKGVPVKAATSVALRAFRDNLRVFDAAMDFVAAQSTLGVNSIVIAATGNESCRDGSPAYTVGAALPAAARGVLSVGAIGQNAGKFEIAPFSNSFPKIVAPGVSIVSAAVGGGLTTMSGTSMACPHAAGVAALWIEFLQKQGRKATVDLVYSKIISSLRRDCLVNPDDDESYGDGLIQAPMKS